MNQAMMQQTRILFTTFLLSSLLFSSCLQWAEVRLNQREPDIITTERIKTFMENNPNPSIVLRVPTSEQQTTESNPSNYYYNTIEKELVKAGFDVKDRGLFNEVITKSKEIDYGRVQELTGVELILELVRIDNSIEFATNRVYDGSKEVILQDHSVKIDGAAIEFKVIIVDNNEYGGSYSFYYTPCEAYVPNCQCYIAYKAGGARVYPYLNYCNENKNAPYETNEQNIMEELVRDGIQKVIYELKHY